MPTIQYSCRGSLISFYEAYSLKNVLLFIIHWPKIVDRSLLKCHESEKKTRQRKSIFLEPLNVKIDPEMPLVIVTFLNAVYLWCQQRNINLVNSNNRNGSQNKKTDHSERAESLSSRGFPKMWVKGHFQVGHGGNSIWWGRQTMRILKLPQLICQSDAMLP